MRAVIRFWSVLALAFAAAAPACAQSDDTADAHLSYSLNLVPGETVAFAPMTKSGDRTARGAFSSADGRSVFTAILARVGIKPGETLPKDLAGRDGFLEFIDKSQSIVLNENGSRATFGFFVLGGRAKSYFILFSYDHIAVDDAGIARQFFAFEVFLFGPAEDDDPGPLRRGLAVGIDGRLLDKVPLELARVSNVLGKEKHDGEPVKPGVEKAGVGCLVCHARKKSDRQSTLPFPWIRPLDSCLVGKWEASTVTSLATVARKPTGGEGFRVVFEKDGTQTIDYAAMKPLEWDKGMPSYNRFTYRGTAKGRIATADRVATIEEVGQAEVTFEFFRGGDKPDESMRQRLPSLGPGGLGTTASDNGYVCTDESLEYKTSIAPDKRPTYSVKLTRIKN